MTTEEFKGARSETARYRHLTTKYCYRADGQPGCVVDIASQGDSVVPWAFGYDLPEREFDHYCGGHPAKGPIQLRGFAASLPFDDGSLDTVYASHYAEDLPRSEWPKLFSEWKRVLKQGGYMVILVPEVKRWTAYLQAGGCPNCSHSVPEPSVGDMSKAALEIGLEVIEERLTDCCPGDYTILGCFRVPKTA